MSNPSDFWLKPGDWRAYEQYVAGTLARVLPDARVSYDVRVRGRKSGTVRQVDVLIEGKFLVAVDCKSYSRRVDVKHVEGFLSMMDDLGVRHGILVTNGGYSQAAVNRAKNDPRKLDLQILSPDRLSQYQCIGWPIIWGKGHVFSVEPVPGWVVDNELTHEEGGALVALYPLGHTIGSAGQHGSLIYLNILAAMEGRALEQIAEPHKATILETHPSASFREDKLKIAFKNVAPRDAFGRLSTYGPQSQRTEYAVYIDFGAAVLLAVLLCPEFSFELTRPLLVRLLADTIVGTANDRDASTPESEVQFRFD